MAPSHALLLALLVTPLDSFYHPVCRRADVALRAQQQRQQRPKRLHKRREPEREPERRSWNPQATTRSPSRSRASVNSLGSTRSFSPTMAARKATGWE